MPRIQLNRGHLTTRLRTLIGKAHACMTSSHHDGCRNSDNAIQRTQILGPCMKSRGGQQLSQSIPNSLCLPPVPTGTPITQSRRGADAYIQCLTDSSEAARLSIPTFLRKKVMFRSLEFCRYPACMLDMEQGPYAPWSGAQMGMSWRSGGRKDGQYGALAGGV